MANDLYSGAAIDLGQLVKLTWGAIQRRYFSPTPREAIEATAPPPFDFANYYNYFLFYAAVALCFGGLQPLALAITALYFWLDSFAKKYLLLYIFITKYESGGMFWRTLFNRMLVCCILSNIITALLVTANGAETQYWVMLAAMAPLPFMIGGFKWYCARTFVDQIHYYCTGKALGSEELAKTEHKRRKGDRVGTRFGHPALFKPLMTPMVHAKSQHLLKSIYSGRTSLDDNRNAAGYSDVYMDTMDHAQPGKSKNGSTAPFEIVQEGEMDFEHWKQRAEFSDQFGGDGELYGRPQDMSRPGTPGSMMTGMTGPTRAGTFESGRSSPNYSESHTPAYHSRMGSRDSSTTRVAEGGVEYPRGYHQTPSALREQSPAGSDWDRQGRGYDMQRTQSHEGLTGSAARMGRSPPPQLDTPPILTPGGYGPVRYGGTPDEDPSLSYDYFRRGRQG